ncbi:hypothetical protein C8034_v009301 [Colletotrichum sidae]|uniref:Cys met metabolism pyridoxal phosphate-dependent enzyme n=4 Tax=Colletotrichum orbiculare species complex TaxID=2707354 RepID=N4VJ57_COLOR|nr:hypothetical protein Cob_v003450 [Colletotrichum orbiculare MAFF 240422]TDZ34402.1 hypothetical protein C8035_v009376 [Colletotrichum spinosum]TDZ61858.1 hypothetical protein CTRI78_v004059 [Colletotrichum trifolii]TEA19606.1 hypothetical protein C8034_v009301 [Colletotrichum sidae]
MSQRYTVGDGSPFLKRVIIPFYVIRIVVMAIDIIAYGLLIGVIASNKDYLDDRTGDETSVSVAIAVAVVLMLIVAACLLLDVLCLIKRSRRTLTPTFFLVANCIETGIWTVLFIISMVGVAGTRNSALSVIIAIIIYASFIGVLIYAGVLYHRHRKGTLRSDYAAATQGQPAAYEPYSNQSAKPNNQHELDNRYA